MKKTSLPINRNCLLKEIRAMKEFNEKQIVNCSADTSAFYKVTRTDCKSQIGRSIHHLQADNQKLERAESYLKTAEKVDENFWELFAKDNF